MSSSREPSINESNKIGVSCVNCLIGYRHLAHYFQYRIISHTLQKSFHVVISLPAKDYSSIKNFSDAG